MKRSILVLILFFVMVAVCYAFYDYSKSTKPDCYSQPTQISVIDLSKKALSSVVEDKTGQDMASDLVFDLQNRRLRDENKDTGTVMCAADFKVVNNKGQYVIFPIIYSVEKTDKSGIFYFTVRFVNVGV